MEFFPSSDELERGKTKTYHFNETIDSDSEDSDDEMDDVLKTFYDNLEKMDNYWEGLEDNEENRDLFYGDLESLRDALDTYLEHYDETKLTVGLPWTQEQLNSEEGRKDRDMQMQYNIWKLCRKYCTYCAKFKFEKAKEYQAKILQLRTEFLEFASNQDGLVRSTNVRSTESGARLPNKDCLYRNEYRRNECCVTLLPAGEVYRLVAKSMKTHYDSEIEMYELSYDLRNQYSKYNTHMMNKHPSIFGAPPAASASSVAGSSTESESESESEASAHVEYNEI